MKRSDIPDLISFLLILMFTYAAASKLSAFDSFKIEMLIQPIPKWSVKYIIYILPSLEIITVILLLIKASKRFGLYLATLLMLTFTIYVGLAMAGAFGSVPCSCGGIIQKLSWPQHFVFNVLFLSISIYGTILEHNERRFIGK